MTRREIHTLAENSDWPAPGIEKALEDSVYPGKKGWLQFLQVFCLTLGVGASLAGVIFFFAYNWGALHKFAKIGLVSLPLAVSVLASLYRSIPLLIRKALLTTGAVLVGVLLAVFGQIYQTGADAYDLFLAWTAGITLWVVIARFPPLTLIYLVLINVTLVLYYRQVLPDTLSGAWWCLVLFTVNALAVVTLRKTSGKAQVPAWLQYPVALAAAAQLIIAFGISLFHRTFPDPSFYVATGTLAITCWLTYRQAMASRHLFYLLVLALCILVSGVLILIRIFGEERMLLLVTGYVVAGLYFIVAYLIRIQRKWKSPAP